LVATCYGGPESPVYEVFQLKGFTPSRDLSHSQKPLAKVQKEKDCGSTPVTFLEGRNDTGDACKVNYRSHKSATVHLASRLALESHNQARPRLSLAATYWQRLVLSSACDCVVPNLKLRGRRWLHKHHVLSSNCIFFLLQDTSKSPSLTKDRPPRGFPMFWGYIAHDVILPGAAR
jgi:hypothetical protein